MNLSAFDLPPQSTAKITRLLPPVDGWNRLIPLKKSANNPSGGRETGE
jgi:hypothetical protein